MPVEEKQAVHTTDPPREKIYGAIYAPRGHVRTYQRETSWLIYAAFALLMSAIVNIAWGIKGLADNRYFGDSLTRSHPATWGWVWIIFGTALLVISTMVLARSLIGLILAGTFAAINAALHIPALSGARSGWAVAVILADLLVIYAVSLPWFRAPDTRH